MKITVINGSARKGNTYTAIQAFLEGASAHEIEIIQPDKLNIAPCKGCNACGCFKGCVDSDDTNPMVNQLVESDLIVFTTPVYWWGMSGQLKLLIDKCYCKGAQLKNKKVGVLVVGGSPLESVQYQLIQTQFECMAKYLNWDLVFYKSYFANKRDDLQNNAEALQELKALGKNI
ncbi:MAG: flavodoxin family protein [Firmicutes bacterium]|nr:flavodoxin family protein [Bacillota bacterium]